MSRRVAELEDSLGVRLIERSTRSLRLTDVGAEVLEHARQGAALSEAVNNIASNHLATVRGTLRLSAPPSLSDSLLAPLVGAFQSSFPEVRVQILVTERVVDHIREGVDALFRIGALRDSSLVARKLLTYRHQLLASADYLKSRKIPRTPHDLLSHRLLCFARGGAQSRWTFLPGQRGEPETLMFEPYFSVNDYAGIAPALLAGAGIGELPPLVRPELLRSGRLVEVMPAWRFRTFDLWLLHAAKLHLPRTVRVFTEFAAEMAPRLFPSLPV